MPPVSRDLSQQISKAIQPRNFDIELPTKEMKSPPVNIRDFDAEINPGSKMSLNQVEGPNIHLITNKDPKSRYEAKYGKKQPKANKNPMDPQEPLPLKSPINIFSAMKKQPQLVESKNPPQTLSSLPNEKPSQGQRMPLQHNQTMQVGPPKKQLIIPQLQGANIPPQDLPLQFKGKLEGQSNVENMKNQPENNEPSLFNKKGNQHSQNLIYPKEQKESKINPNLDKRSDDKKVKNTDQSLRAITELEEQSEDQENMEMFLKLRQRTQPLKAKSKFRFFSDGRALMRWGKIRKHVQDLDLIRQ